MTTVSHRGMVLSAILCGMTTIVFVVAADVDVLKTIDAVFANAPDGQVGPSYEVDRSGSRNRRRNHPILENRSARTDVSFCRDALNASSSKMEPSALRQALKFLDQCQSQDNETEVHREFALEGESTRVH